MHTNNDAVTVSVSAGLVQPDNADSFQNALDDIDAVTVSVSAGLVQKRKTVEKDSRSEVRWELAEGTRGSSSRSTASGGARRAPPTYEEKLLAVLQHKCCDLVASWTAARTLWIPRGQDSGRITSGQR